MSVVRISNALSTAVPQNATPSRSVTITTAAPVIVAALNSDTQAVYFTITGGLVRVTFDGSTPTATNGHRMGYSTAESGKEDGAWSPIMASAARAFSESGDPIQFYITEINYR